MNELLKVDDIDELLSMLRNQGLSTHERLIALRVLSKEDDPRVWVGILRAAFDRDKSVARRSSDLIREADPEKIFVLLDRILLNTEDSAYFGPKMFETLYKLRERDVVKYMILGAVSEDEEWNEKKQVLSKWMRSLGIMEKYIDVLGGLPTNAATALGKVLKRIDERVVSDIARSVRGANKDRSIKLLDVLSEIADNATIAPVLVNLLSDDDKRIRSKTALVLGKLSDNLHFFWNALKDPDARVRANAVEGLWGLRNPNVREIYREAIHDENNRVRANAAKGLYEINDPLGLEVLEDMLLDHDKMMRASAAWVLGEVRDTTLVDKLEQIAETDAAEIAQENAIRALSKIVLNKVKPAMYDLMTLISLSDLDSLNNPFIFFKRICDLKSVSRDQRTEILTFAPPENSGHIRRKLIQTIVDDIGESENDPTLFLTLIYASAQPNENSFWDTVIKKTQAVIDAPESALAALEEGALALPKILTDILEMNRPPQLIPAIAKLLRWESDSGVSQIVNLLDDEDPEVRGYAIHALEQLCELSAAEKLDEMSRSDPHPAVRENAALVAEEFHSAIQRSKQMPEKLKLKVSHVSIANLPHVSISVSLTDSNAELFRDIAAENFVLIENGKILPHRLEEADPSMPMSAVILMDYSLSMLDDAISTMEDSVLELSSTLKSNSMIAICKFAAEILMTQALTPADKFDPSTVKGNHNIDRSGTLLYDAIAQAIDDLKDQNGTRFAIVLTDGEDSGSIMEVDKLIDKAIEHEVSIHAIGLGDEVDEKSLEKIVVSTGGAYYSAMSHDDLKQIYRDISSSMQCQHRIVYQSEAFSENREHAFLVIRADLGCSRSETWTKVVFRNA